MRNKYPDDKPLGKPYRSFEDVPSLHQVVREHFKFELSKEWCLESARLEGNSEIGCGLATIPLVDYSQDDLTEYLSRKVDCDGNDLEYERANLLFWFEFNHMKWKRKQRGET